MLVFYVGGGPRTVAQITAEIDFLLKHMRDFKCIEAKGGRYDIRSTVAERRGREYIGRGSAWGPDQGGGTVNTGADRAHGRTHEVRLATFISDKRSVLEAQYRDNPVAASTLRSAFDGSDAPGDGEPTTARGVLTRADQGDEEAQTFWSKLKRIQDVFPSYSATILEETSVQGIDLSRPDQPGVTLASSAPTPLEQTVYADFVRLNTGTTTTSPVSLSDSRVRQRTFARPMDPQDMHAFLGSLGLLDAKGMLKPQTRLALGGTGLSAYDQIIVLQRAMNLLEPHDGSIAGYRVTQWAKDNYQGAITFISNTPGKWVPPRHVSKDAAWTQRNAPLGNSHELHAAFLHDDGRKVFQDWDALMTASIASALGMLPDEVAQKGLTTEELLDRQHQSNRLHATKMDEAANLQGPQKQSKIDEAMQTLEGARRQAFMQAIMGLGMEKNLDVAFRRMEADAPLTFRGRGGYPMHRAQLCAVTQVDEDGTLPDNRALSATLDQWMADITASPVRVQELAYMLFEAGIATHLPGSYSDLVPNEKPGKALRFPTAEGRPRTFDAFIVSPVFMRGAEPVIASLAGQVEPAHGSIPDLGKVTSHRRVLTAQGVPSHLQDFSLNGKGDVVPGTLSRVGAFALDVNNHESAVETALPMAYFRMAIEHLAAVGIAHPIRVVEDLYAQQQPSREKFDAEVRGFERHYESLTEKAAFVRFAREAAQSEETDAAKAARFASLADQARSGSRARMQGSLLAPLMGLAKVGRQCDVFRAASAGFADALAQRKPFKPVSRDAFLRRFVDIPLHVHEKVYRAAVERALEHATGNKSSPQFVAGATPTPYTLQAITA